MNNVLDMWKRLSSQHNDARHNSAALAAAWIVEGIDLQLTTVRQQNALPLPRARK